MRSGRHDEPSPRNVSLGRGFERVDGAIFSVHFQRQIGDATLEMPRVVLARSDSRRAYDALAQQPNCTTRSDQGKLPIARRRAGRFSTRTIGHALSGSLQGRGVPVLMGRFGRLLASREALSSWRSAVALSPCAPLAPGLNLPCRGRRCGRGTRADRVPGLAAPGPTPAAARRSGPRSSTPCSSSRPRARRPADGGHRARLRRALRPGACPRRPGRDRLRASPLPACSSAASSSPTRSSTT